MHVTRGYEPNQIYSEFKRLLMKITNEIIAERVFGLKMLPSFSNDGAYQMTSGGTLKNYMGDICAAWEVIDEMNKKSDDMKKTFDTALFAILNNDILAGMDATIQIDPIRIPRYLKPEYISRAAYIAMGGE